MVRILVFLRQSLVLGQFRPGPAGKITFYLYVDLKRSGREAVAFTVVVHMAIVLTMPGQSFPDVFAIKHPNWVPRVHP